MAGEWVEVDRPWIDARYLIKAGMQLEMQDPGTKQLTRYLVGEINELGGTCDDCRAFHRDDIVVRYRVVVDMEAIK